MEQVATLRAGTELGDYVVHEHIGSGAFGEVYRCSHRHIGGEVAIKILHADRCRDTDVVARFVGEARAVNKIRHPHIVDVFDFGRSQDGRSYLVMELLRGRTLRDLLDERRLLALDRAIPILRGIAEAIDAAHAAGIAHRDLKPENVFLLADGGVKLIDFGLAKLVAETGATATGTVLGTPRYMSPEQCRGDQIDQRCDLYGFGALAYHTLTGTPPFSGDAIAVALAHLNERPVRPSRRVRSLPTAIDAPVLALLAKDPNDRPSPLIGIVAQLAMRPRRARRRYAVVAVAAAAAAAAMMLLVRPAGGPDVPGTRVIDPAKVNVRALSIGPHLLPFWLRGDGALLRYRTLRPNQCGAYRFDVRSDVIESCIDDESELPDGRRVESDGSVVIRDPETRADRYLGPGRWAEPCPLGGSVAAVAAGRLVVYDVASGAARDLGAAPNVWGLRWSPDCSRLVWASPQIHVTDVATGFDRTTPVTALSVHGPAAFVDRDAIAYCGRVADTTVVAVHYLDGRAADATLAPLPPDSNHCSLAASADGHRLVVFVEQLSGTTEVVDVAATPTRPTEIAGTDDHFVIPLQFRGDHVIAARTHVDAIGPTLDRAFFGGPYTLVDIARDGTRTPMSSCPGARMLTRYRGQLAFVTLAGSRLAILDEACHELVAVMLPGARGWSVPRCADTTCVLAQLSDDKLTLYQLLPSLRELVQMSREPAVADVAAVPAVAIAPDGMHAAAAVLGESTYHVVELATRHASPIVWEGSRIEELQWGAQPEGFYVTAFQNHLGEVVARVVLDGTRELVPVGISVSAVSATGRELAGVRRANRVAVFEMELP